MVVNEPLTYAERDVRYSYFRDLAHLHCGTADAAAQDRMRRHEVDVAERPEFTELRRGSPSRHVPPLWMLEQAAQFSAASRVYTNLAVWNELPPGTETVMVPTRFGSNEDALSVSVAPVAGAQGISTKLLDQSPIMFDAVVWRDLLVDYAQRLNRQVIDSVRLDAHRMELRRVLTVGGDGDDRGAVEQVCDAAQYVRDHRYLLPDAVVMHPARWAIWLGQFVGSGKIREAYKGEPPAAAMGFLRFEPKTGDPIEIPIYPDAAMIDEDRDFDRDFIHVAHTGDLSLWESDLWVRVLDDEKPGKLIFQAYAYSAFCSRFPATVVELQGPEGND